MNPHLSGVIEGEAALAGCHFLSLIAIAWVYTRNQQFYGCAEPGGLANMAAMVYPFLPDLSFGADFAFGANDLSNREVERIVAEGEITVIYPCREWGRGIIFVKER